MLFSFLKVIGEAVYIKATSEGAVACVLTCAELSSFHAAVTDVHEPLYDGIASLQYACNFWHVKVPPLILKQLAAYPGCRPLPKRREAAMYRIIHYSTEVGHTQLGHIYLLSLN